MFVALAWMFLGWRFTGDTVELIVTNPDLFTFQNNVASAALTVGAALLHGRSTWLSRCSTSRAGPPR